MFSTSRGFVPAWKMEGMFLLAIVGVALAIAIPAYVTYKARSATEDALKRVTPVSDAVSAYFLRTGETPRDNAELGEAQLRAALGGSIKAVTVKDGTIVVELTGLGVNGKSLVLRPAVYFPDPTRPLRWVCQDGPAPDGWIVIGRDQPVDRIEEKYLPQSCRPGG